MESRRVQHAISPQVVEQVVAAAAVSPTKQGTHCHHCPPTTITLTNVFLTSIVHHHALQKKRRIVDNATHLQMGFFSFAQTCLGVVRKLELGKILHAEHLQTRQMRRHLQDLLQWWLRKEIEWAASRAHLTPSYVNSTKQQQECLQQKKFCAALRLAQQSSDPLSCLHHQTPQYVLVSRVWTLIKLQNEIRIVIIGYDS